MQNIVSKCSKNPQTVWKEKKNRDICQYLRTQFFLSPALMAQLDRASDYESEG